MSAGSVDADGDADRLADGVVDGAAEELVVGSVGVEFMRHTVLQGFELRQKTNILLPLRKPNLRVCGGCWGAGGGVSVEVAVRLAVEVAVGPEVETVTNAVIAVNKV